MEEVIESEQWPRAMKTAKVGVRILLRRQYHNRVVTSSTASMGKASIKLVDVRSVEGEWTGFWREGSSPRSPKIRRNRWRLDDAKLWRATR